MRLARYHTISVLVAVLSPNPKPKPPKPNTAGKPKGVNANKIGLWDKVTYGDKDKDCAVTYTCNYGNGRDFAEVESSSAVNPVG